MQSRSNKARGIFAPCFTCWASRGLSRHDMPIITRSTIVSLRYFLAFTRCGVVMSCVKAVLHKQE
jgi:hypothetical protein